VSSLLFQALRDRNLRPSTPSSVISTASAFVAEDYSRRIEVGLWLAVSL
jgi:hypothetical protein